MNEYKSEQISLNMYLIIDILQIKSNQKIIYSRYRDTTYCDTNVLAGEP